MKSKYTSGKSVAKNQTVPIGVDDPRLKWDKRGQTYARQGAEIQEIGANNKSLIAGGTNTNNATGSSGVNNSKTIKQVVIPPSNGNPSYSIDADLITPSPVTNVSTAWSGEDLIVTFDWDKDDEANISVSEFIIELTAEGTTARTSYGLFPVNRTQNEQTATVKESIIASTLGAFRTNITSVCVYAIDAFYNISSSACDTSVPTYVLNLPIPVITVAAATNGYNVSYTIPTQSIFDAIDIYEYESNASSEPTGVTYSRVYFDNISPANIITTNTNARWVKAKFTGRNAGSTAFCAAQKVTPIDPITVDTTGPSNVTSVTVSTGIDTSGYLGFNGYADISWPAVSDSTLRGYRIRFSNDGGTTYSYADSPGSGTTYRLGGLAAGSTYKIAVATYDEFNNTSSSYVSVSPDVTIPGTAAAPLTVTAGQMQLGYGVGGSTSNRGLYFDTSNYWYITSDDTARLKVGGDTQNYLYWDGAKVTVDGDIIANGGQFSGNILMSTSGASIYNGTINTNGNLTGDGFALNSDGLKVASGSNSVTIDAANGRIIANAGDIGGWIITATEIYKTQTGQGKISLNSGAGYISISNDGIEGKTAGINSPSLLTDNVFWSSGTGPTDETSSFRVKLNGNLYANNADIKGIIKATSGGFGQFTGSNTSPDNGWEISADGIEAKGTGQIKVATGRVQVGDYSIKSLDTELGDFTIYDDNTLTTILTTETTSASLDPKRIFLGDINRQVEVAKSAGLSGQGTTATIAAATATDLSAYRSGGLRNIFTIASGQVTSDGSGNILEYPSAIKGDMLVVYDPSTPGNTQGWKSIVGIYINNKSLPAPTMVAAPEVTPTSGTEGITQFSCDPGTWTADSTITYSYSWRYDDYGTWSEIPGSGTSSTYTPSSTFTSQYGSSLRCYVTATANGVSATFPAPPVTVNSSVSPITPITPPIVPVVPVTPPTVQYTIGWNANGGTVTPSSTTVTAGESVTAPLPTRSGYTFSYWVEPPVDPLYIYNAGDVFTPTSSFTMTAIWVQNVAPAIVSGGEPDITPDTGTAGTTQYSCDTGDWTGVPTPTYTYQWKFSDFGVWSDIPGETSSTYTPPSNYVSLYGSSLRCFVTATNAAGSATQGSVAVIVNAPVTPVTPPVTPVTPPVTPVTPVTPPVTPVTPVTPPVTPVTPVTPPIAPVAPTVQYTITWAPNGGTVDPTSTTVNAGQSLTAPIPTRSGYVFYNWRYPSGGDLLEEISGGGTYTPTSSKTFTAVWTVAPVAPVAPVTPPVAPVTPVAPPVTPVAPVTPPVTPVAPSGCSSPGLVYAIGGTATCPSGCTATSSGSGTGTSSNVFVSCGSFYAPGGVPYQWKCCG